MSVVTKAIIVSILNNTLLIFLKIIFGIFGHSNALIADGIHSISDLSTDVVAYYGYRSSNLPGDDDHPFGHGRIEYLTSLAIGAFVLFLGGGIIYRSLQSSEILIPENIVSVVIVITIILKYIVSEHLIRTGKRVKNKILTASGNESRADVLTSIIVLVTFILSKFHDSIDILKYADKAGSIIVGLFIIKTAFSIIKDSSLDVIGKVEIEEEEIAPIRELILNVLGVERVDSLSLMKFGPYYKAIVKIAVDANDTVHHSHEIAHDVEDALIESEFSIHYVTVHINPYYGDHHA